MSVSRVEVWLWGRHVASLAAAADGRVTFRYTPEFSGSGIELAPLLLPLSDSIYTGFDRRSNETFRGLPPLVVDSLPDRFGNALIRQYLAAAGRDPDSFTPLERLSYVGARGMGALEYRPATERDAVPDEALDVARLVRLASEALRAKEGLRVDATDDAGLGDEEGLRQILSVGTSAGGARAKAVVAWHPERREIRSGQLTDLPDGFEHWLLKFDGVDENRDKEALADPLGYGRIEYAYSRMARDAGIEMTECHLHEEGGRAHFMTRRFDRVGARGRLHYQSLCAMEGYDFNEPRTASYELAFQTMRKLGLGVPDLDQQVRRTVFNVVCRNQDDHTKNIGFLMDREGRWRLSPAFDVTYAYNPSGAWTRAHQMTLGLKSDGFERADVTEPLAKASGLGMADVEAIVDRTVEVASRWSEYADEAGVADPSHRRIDETFRML